jgi:hypothetical protein
MPEPIESTEPVQSVDESKSEILQTVNESLNDLGDGVRELAAAMKDGAPEAWRIMVRQTEISAWTTLAAGTFVIVVTAAIYIFIGKHIRRWKRKVAEAEEGGNNFEIDRARFAGELANGWGIGRVLGGAVILMITVLVLLDKEVPAKLMNPEYYAAKDLIQTLGTAKCR